MDEGEVEGGNVVIVKDTDPPTVRVVPKGSGRWVTHFSTCPAAKEHRKAPRARR